MYIAYEYETGNIIEKSPTISGLSKKLNINRKTVATHISRNVGREYLPARYMGRYCFIDDSCTDIMVKIPDNNDDAEIFHVYKASTGEYICPCTLQALCDALEIKVKASLVRAIDNFPLTKYNIYVSKECQDNIVPPKPVYEIFTENNNLVLSTFYPDNYKYWKPAGLQYNLNPYKPNHYMLKLPQNFNNVPAQPTVDYLQYPEKILLDNNES